MYMKNYWIIQLWGRKLLTEHLKEPCEQQELPKKKTGQVESKSRQVGSGISIPSSPGVDLLDDSSLFTPDELERAAAKLPVCKAFGPDFIPNEVLAVVTNRRWDVLLRVFNECMRAGVFSAPWKVTRLIILHKGPGKSITSTKPANCLSGSYWRSGYIPG